MNADQSVIARSLLGACLLADPDAIDAALSVPRDAWPDPELAGMADVLDGLRSEGDTIEPAAIVAAAGGLAVRWVSLCDNGVTTPTRDPWRCAADLKRLHAARMFEERKRHLAQALPTMTAEELRIFLADADLFEGIEDPAPVMVTEDVSRAGDPDPGLFEGHVYPRKVNEIVGESGGSKSFCALTLAVSLAHGRRLIRPFDPVAPCETLFMSAEDDGPVLKRRLQSIGAMHGIDDPFQGIRFVTRAEPLIETDRYGRVTPTRAYDALAGIVKDARLVVIDPFANWVNLADENSNSQMGATARLLLRFAQETDTAVLVVHHANKAGAGRADQASSRGGSALACAARWIMHLAPVSPKTVDTYGIEGDEDRFIEASISKNTNSERRRSPIILERGPGGALRNSTLRSDRTECIAQELASLIVKHDARLTRRDLAKSTADLARTIREELKEAIPGLSRGDIEAALSLGVASGLFSEAPDRQKDGRPGRVIEVRT